MNTPNHSVLSFIERMEKIKEERAELTTDLREVRAEAKGLGYDLKALDLIMRLRSMGAGARAELIGSLLAYSESAGINDFEVLSDE